MNLPMALSLASMVIFLFASLLGLSLKCLTYVFGTRSIVINNATKNCIKMFLMSVLIFVVSALLTKF